MTEPVRPPIYQLTEMEPSWFEQLCWRLLWIEHPTVRFIENPDGGVDAILPSEDGTRWVRAWQAKRYTGHVKWGECEASYDAAIANYKVLHLTFCFARDLTGAQERTFVKRLGQRRKGVLCDWIGRMQLHKGLTETEQGRAVARFFFKSDTVDLDALDRALKLGRVIENTGQAVAHLGEVGRFLGTQDPYFDIETSNYPAGHARPAAPGSIISLFEEAEHRTTQLDVLPRDSESIRLYGPQFEIHFSADEAGERARRALDQALEHHTAARIDGGLRIRFTRYPTFLEQQLGSELTPETLELTPGEPVRVRPSPWRTLLSVKDQGELGTLPIKVTSVAAPEGWDFCLVGSHANAELRILSRWREDAGEMNFRLSHKLQGPHLRDQASALRIIRALGEGGILVIGDQDGRRPVIELGPAAPESFSAESQAKLALLEDLILIEERTGREFSMPDTMDQQTFEQIRQIAQGLRLGEWDVRIGEMEMQVDRDGLARLKEGGQLAWVAPEMTYDVLGQSITLGGVITIPAFEIVSIRDSGELPGQSLVTVRPASGQEDTVIRLEVREPREAAEPRA
jgi:hypothetical protein